jgi:hypothetical protein
VVCSVDLIFFFTRATSIRIPEINQVLMELSFIGDSCTDSMEGSDHVEILCFEDTEGATEQFPRSPEASGTLASWKEFLSSGKPSSENLEVLAVSFGNLDLKIRKKNRSGATKKRARKAGSQRLLLGTAGQYQQGSRLGAARPEPSKCPVYLGCTHKKRKDC